MSNSEKTIKDYRRKETRTNDIVIFAEQGKWCFGEVVLIHNRECIVRLIDGCCEDVLIIHKKIGEKIINVEHLFIKTTSLSGEREEIQNIQDGTILIENFVGYGLQVGDKIITIDNDDHESGYGMGFCSAQIKYIPSMSAGYEFPDFAVIKYDDEVRETIFENTSFIFSLSSLERREKIFEKKP